MDYLVSKDLSRGFLPNYVISFFRLHLMLYVCVQIFNVTGSLKIFWELNVA
jgi:hypothetical protein